MSKTALGLIETYGYTASVEAADVCLKAANVSLSACKKVRGGLVTIEIIGDVGAVKAAIDAAEAAVPRVGKLISTHVIPRPAAELDSILGDNSFNSSAPEDPKDPNDPDDKEDSKAKKDKEDAQESETKSNDSDAAAKKESKEAKSSKKEAEAKAEKKKTKSTKDKEKAKKEQPTKKELKEHKVVELRSLARELENIKLSNKEIKYARKKELIEAILDAKK